MFYFTCIGDCTNIDFTQTNRIWCIMDLIKNKCSNSSTSAKNRRPEICHFSQAAVYKCICIYEQYILSGRNILGSC